MGDFDFKTTEFKLSGFAELHRNIEHLTQIQRHIGLSPLLVKSLEPMAALARSIAPDDPKTPPPYDLKSSIVVSTRQRSGRAKQDRPLGKYEARAYMGPTKYGYPQAIMMEFGTVHDTAQPYMRPAYEATKYQTLEIIKAGFAAQVAHTVALFGVAPAR